MVAKPFKGVVNIDVRDSIPDWTPFRETPAPEGAPNVLLVLYDDTGMAAWPPLPSITMRNLSPPAVIGPWRIAKRPTGMPGQLCMP